MKGLMQYAGWLIYDFRCSVGLALLSRALRVLPQSFSLREGIERGIIEQTNYDRYAAYTKLCGGTALPFDRWREVHRWMRTRRPAYGRAIRDFSRLHVVRETA